MFCETEKSVEKSSRIIMQHLNVTLVQTDLVWQNPKANRKQIGLLLKKISMPTNVVVLPEMFSTGFSMQPKKLAEKPNGITAKWMSGWAARLNAAIVGSIIVKEKDNYYNRLIWMPPNGVPQFYDKKHLFTLAGEHQCYTAGAERLIIKNYMGWNICPLICYDLRFPEWARNTTDFDLLIYVANWPTPRIDAWTNLLQARAIENQCYTVGVNRIGKDGKDNAYNGNSAVNDFKGNAMLRIADSPFVHTITLEKKPMRQFRQQYPFLGDMDVA